MGGRLKLLVVAFKNLMRRRLRSLLTLLGVALGIAMVLSSLSFDRGFQAGLQAELARMGAHVLAVAKGCPYEATAMIIHGGVIRDFLDEADLARIREMPNVGNAAGLFMNQLTGHGKPTVIVGLDEAGFDLKPWWVIRGERFTGPDSVILPAELAERLGVEPGQEWVLPAAGRRLTVTGILERTGSQDDQFVYLPLATAQAIFDAPGKLTTIAVQVLDLSLLGEVVRQVEGLPDVQAVTMGQVLGTAQTLLGSVRGMVQSLVLITVLVGALGIMNAILTAVFERTREIGMMKAVGASPLDVFVLVWMESVLLGLAGGIAGIALTVTFGRTLEGAVRDLLPFTPAGNLLVLDWSLVLTSIWTALGLGIAAGAYPAFRASRLSPMEAIRSE